jgi:predicted DNA-binding transcriptional regulator YafY
VHDATATLAQQEIEVDAEVLVSLARACRDTVRVRFRYAARDGAEQERTVEPVQMVTTGRRWYLMAFDVDRDDWRTFRLDRMHQVTTSTFRFRPREHPDPVAYVQQAVTASPYPHQAKVRLRATVDEIRALVPPQVAGVEDDEEDGWCVLTAGTDSLDWLAVHIAGLGFETDVVQPPELRTAAATLARKLTAIAER